MSKLFKVGDKVVRTDKITGKTMRGEIVTKGPGPAIDIKLTEGAGNYNAGDIYGGSADFWQLIEEVDELPPVPSSVTYLNTKRDPGNDQRLVLERYSETDEGLLYIGVVPRKNSTRAEQAIGINMSPDAALQLAHDLRRMAMSIKREQK
ncbi:hypothetical protein KMI5_18 [Klebsiella phage KMI5]|uniref:Uncharacterized protein n=1 Tax=Klebsiella phage KMI3 TaxID=2601614 RepID=A0A5B9N7D4_9CAUD|nr:hypothetical protein KMI3_11 [Klebsiella phage KMI3]QEG10077.1 hypothetical protein KMI5_18 [Klebsiella phage KMI5]